VRNYSLSSRLSDFSFLHLTAVSILNAVGLDGFARSLEQSGAFAAVERLNLDGLLALWHPSPVN
jgi:protease-4